MRWIGILAALLVGLSAASGQTPWSRDMLVGRWYGEKFFEAAQENAQWIADRRADGTFVTELRLYDGCRLKTGYVFSGTWSFDGKIYTSRMLMLQSREIDRIDTYEFFELTDRSMAYLHREGQTRYTARKVEADFKFPPCVTS